MVKSANLMKATMMITIQVELVTIGRSVQGDFFIMFHHTGLEIIDSSIQFNMKMMHPTVLVNPRARSIGPCFVDRFTITTSDTQVGSDHTQPASHREIIVQIIFPVALEFLLV